MLKLYARMGEGEPPPPGVRSFLFKAEPYWALLVRVLLAFLFIYSAWHKIEDPVSFQMKVYEYEFPPASWVESVNSWTGFDFHPEEWTGPVSRVLPWLMVISGALLLVGFLSRAGALLQVFMLLLFTAAIEVNIYREVVMSCGCFSEEGHSIGIDLVVRNLFLLVLSGYVLDRGPGRFALDRFLLKIYRGLGDKN
ncbi:MAG: MauE/DoxX family redox-associated membrane protein [bacterium]